MRLRMPALRAMVSMALILFCRASTDGGDSDPKVAYTIKLRVRQIGETCHVTETVRTSSPTIRESSGAEPTLQVETHTTSFAFTEEVQARTAAGDVLSRAQRAYTTAEVSAEGKTRSLSFAGKTVLIERQPNKVYTFKIQGGAAVKEEDAEHFTGAFNSAKSTNHQACLPTKPVKVNEVWDLSTGRKGTQPTAGAKTTGTGKLIRVYQQDGRQYGVFTLHLEMVATPGFPAISADITFDGCIDGTSTDGTLKTLLAIPFVVPTANGDLQLRHTIAREMAVRSVK